MELLAISFEPLALTANLILFIYGLNLSLLC